MGHIADRNRAALQRVGVDKTALSACRLAHGLTGPTARAGKDRRRPFAAARSSRSSAVRLAAPAALSLADREYDRRR